MMIMMRVVYGDDSKKMMTITMTVVIFIFFLTTNKLQKYNVQTLRPFHLFLSLFSFSWFLFPFFLYLNRMRRVLMWSSHSLLSHFHPH